MRGRRFAGTGLAVALLAAAVLTAAPPAGALEEADRLWLVGERAFQDRLYPVARPALERLLQRFPDDPRIPQAVLLLGKARLAQADLPAALEAFRRAQGFSPPPGAPEEARFWEGETLFRLRRYEEARQVLDRMLSDNAAAPQAPDALYTLGWAQVELKRLEGAVLAFRQLLEAFPDHARAPAAAVDLGRLLVDLKRYDEAATVLGPFAERHPGHRLVPDARFLLAWMEVPRGDTEAAIRGLRAFVAAYPTHELAARARRALVDTLLRAGRGEDLEREYEALTARSPRTAEGLYDAGAIAARLGRAREAEAAWTALRSDFAQHPLAARAALELGEAALGRGAAQDALGLAREAVGAEDQAVQARAWLLVGEAELRLKHYPAALSAFETAAASPAQDPALRFRALAGSGLAHEEQRRWAQAKRFYDEVAAQSVDRELAAWAVKRRAAVAARLEPPRKAGEARAPERKKPEAARPEPARPETRRGAGGKP